MPEHPSQLSQEEIVRELFARAFAAGLSIGTDTSGIRLWVHVVYGGNQYNLEWQAGRGVTRRILSPVGRDTEWAIYEKPHSEWVPADEQRGGA